MAINNLASRDSYSNPTSIPTRALSPSSHRFIVHVRVDKNLKAQAEETLASMGLTISDAVRVFLTRVVADKELPFALQAPNATSRAAIAEANEIINSRRARFATADALLNDLEEASRK